ncbi:MAG: hypothetical protein ACOVQI_07290 [Tagaea sp.]
MTRMAARALACLDLTALGDAETPATTAELCAKARTPHGPVAAVCLWPAHVAQAKAALAGTAIKVATVVNFPGGMEPVDAVLAATRRALAATPLARRHHLDGPWPTAPTKSIWSLPTRAGCAARKCPR